MPQLSSILLVDDDATANFLNRALIERAAVAGQVLVAEDGEQALRVLTQVCGAGGPACPVLILLDVNMPVMNGIEFLEAYEQLPLPRREAIIIVMLTTTLLPRDLTRLQQLPVAAMLNKPLTKQKLRTLLDQYFPASSGS